MLPQQMLPEFTGPHVGGVTLGAFERSDITAVSNPVSSQLAVLLEGLGAVCLGALRKIDIK